MSDDQVAAPPPSPDERAAFKQDLRAALNCLDAANAREAALLTRQEALLAFDLHCENFTGRDFQRSEYDLCIKYGRQLHAEYADDQACWPCCIRAALLDASQPVKPPVLPEPDLRLMGEAVKGGKYPEQTVKP